MPKKPLPPPVKAPGTQPVPPEPTGSPASDNSKGYLGELEKRVAYLEKYVDLQARLNDDCRLTLVCVLEGIKKAQGLAGVSLMPKGSFYGVKF